jgi:hypothetical protein
MDVTQESTGWVTADVEARCIDLKATLVAESIASDAEVAAYWPGGSENTESDPHGRWVYCYANYIGFLHRLAPELNERAQAAGDAALLEALRGAPVTVELVGQHPDGSPKTVQVYPKSYEALEFLDALDAAIGRLAAAEDLVTSLHPGEALPLLDRLAEARSLLHRQCVWVVTAEGPRLPFAAFGAPPDPPDSTRDLDVVDIVRILQAFKTLHRDRLAALSALMGRGKGGRRVSWATLASSAAGKLGVSAQTLLRDWSLEGWIAQLQLAADAERDAHEASQATAA